MASKEHLELSEYIKSVHQDLRGRSKDIGVMQAWTEHCKKEDVLKKYASAMKTLATVYWDKSKSSESENSASRIEWVVLHCQQYFLLDERQEQIHREIALAERLGIPYDKSILDNLKKQGESLELLDVGSCFNPFKFFKMFKVTAVDLCPASEDVIKCDFLDATVNETGVMRRQGYNIIVFSLFLEYLPSSELRYRSCAKAYDLLKPSGLLFILTPDSKHATANSKLMKFWRICLASLGFTRVYYEKLKHLHCMAFKKAFIKDLPSRWFQIKNVGKLSSETMLTIPQDSLQVQLGTIEDCPFDPQQVADNFNSLPHGLIETQ